MQTLTISYNETGIIEASVIAYELSHMLEDCNVITLAALAIVFKTIEPITIDDKNYVINLTHYTPPQWDNTLNKLNDEDLLKYKNQYKNIFKDVRIQSISPTDNIKDMTTTILTWLCDQEKVFLTDDVIAEAIASLRTKKLVDDMIETYLY